MQPAQHGLGITAACLCLVAPWTTTRSDPHPKPPNALYKDRGWASRTVSGMLLFTS